MTLHTKYRPTTFDEVIGQGSVAKRLQEMLKEGTSRSFLLHGPAGTGKTTLARIIATESGCSGIGIIEVDGATYTGIDAMRKLSDSTHYKSISETGKACYIVDECHMLSKAAWNSLLKFIEEPPEHVIWVFCTTEPHKVPKTIRSRCAEFMLSLVEFPTVKNLLTSIVAKEQWDTPDEIIELVCRSAHGSPRKALVNLALCHNVEDLDTGKRLLKEAAGPVNAFNLAQCIFDDREFKGAKVRAILTELKDVDPEGIRIVVFAYATSVWLKASSSDKATWAAKVLGQFETPSLDRNRIGDIALRVARLLHLKNAPRKN